MLSHAIAAAHAQNLDGEARQLAGAFVRWCADHGVQSCPAAPKTVAGFVRWFAQSMAANQEEMAAALDAVADLHDGAGAANPVATAAVRAELIRVLRLKPPRGWRDAEKPLFADLPPEIQAIVARREEQRDTELRRLQNEVAKLRHGGAKSASIEKEISR
jgi:hypothetical protein